jgi:hypothetical protein
MTTAELTVVASITSRDVVDDDCVPTHDEGVCRYWGAFPDSPIPNVRVFVVFDRTPTSEEEAFAAAKSHFGDDEGELGDEDEDYDDE